MTKFSRGLRIHSSVKPFGKWHKGTGSGEDATDEEDGLEVIEERMHSRLIES